MIRARNAFPHFFTRRVPLLAPGLLLIAAGSASATPASPQLIGQMWVQAPPSWSAPIVPRMRADADSAGPVAPSDSLLSGGLTYLNWSTEKNEAICGSWTDELDFDGQPLEYLTRSNCEWARIYFPAVNQGPIAVRGGRHELTVKADIYWQVATDYSFRPFPGSGQFVWSPMPLPEHVLGGGPTPPPPGFWPIPNCDGFGIDRANPWAWVVSEIATSPAADCDLIVYTDPWRGGGTGFSVEAARSTQPAGQLDFVVGSSSSAPTSVFPAVVRGGAGAAGGYFLTWTDSADQRDSTADQTWTGSIGSGRLAQVYETWLEAGVPVHMDLTRLGGAEDIAFSVFPPTPGGTWGRAQAAATSTQLASADVDALTFTASQSGWHPIVVYLAQSAASAINVIYRLRVGPSAVLDVDAGRTGLFLSAAVPNPASDGAHFAFGLATDGQARLALYDLGGRRVRTLVDALLSAGRHGTAWDLRDADGVRVAAGMYWARFEAEGRSVMRRVAVVR